MFFQRLSELGVILGGSVVDRHVVEGEGGLVKRIVNIDGRDAPLCEFCKDPSDSVDHPEYLEARNGTKIGMICANLIAASLQKGGCDQCHRAFDDGAVMYDSGRLVICIECAKSIAEVMNEREKALLRARSAAADVNRPSDTVEVRINNLRAD